MSSIQLVFSDILDTLLLSIFFFINENFSWFVTWQLINFSSIGWKTTKCVVVSSLLAQSLMNFFGLKFHAREWLRQRQTMLEWIPKISEQQKNIVINYNRRERERKAAEEVFFELTMGWHESQLNRVQWTRKPFQVCPTSLSVLLYHNRMNYEGVDFCLPTFFFSSNSEKKSVECQWTPQENNFGLSRSSRFNLLVSNQKSIYNHVGSVQFFFFCCELSPGILFTGRERESHLIT